MSQLRSQFKHLRALAIRCPQLLHREALRGYAHLTFVPPFLPSLQIWESVLRVELRFLRVKEIGVNIWLAVPKQPAGPDIHLVNQVRILGVLYLPHHFVLPYLFAVQLKALKVLKEDLILLELLSFELPLCLEWHPLNSFLFALEAHGGVRMAILQLPVTCIVGQGDRHLVQAS